MNNILRLFQPDVAASRIRICSKILQFSNFEGSPHRVNNLEKKFLVWTGKFKTVKEVPAFVSQSTMERCRNRMRIKIANYMMAATVLGCIAMIYASKQAATRGETIGKLNLEWHKEMENKIDSNQKST